MPATQHKQDSYPMHSRSGLTRRPIWMATLFRPSPPVNGRFVDIVQPLSSSPAHTATSAVIGYTAINTQLSHSYSPFHIESKLPYLYLYRTNIKRIIERHRMRDTSIEFCLLSISSVRGHRYGSALRLTPPGNLPAAMSKDGSPRLSIGLQRQHLHRDRPGVHAHAF